MQQSRLIGPLWCLGLLDEPTNALDEASDRLLVEQLATHAVILDEGRMEEAVIHSHPLPHSQLHVHAPGLADHSHPGARTRHRCPPVRLIHPVFPRQGSARPFACSEQPPRERITQGT